MSILIPQQSTIGEFQNSQQKVPIDVVLVCQGERFGVHREILARKLDYFRSLFDQAVNSIIEITEISKEVLYVIISSCYEGRFKTKNYRLIPELLFAFQKIKYQEAYEWYLKCLLKYLSKGNWEEFWELGENLNEERFFEAVRNLMVNNYNLPEFLSSQMKWKLFVYLSKNRDYEILVKVALCFPKDLGSVNTLISLIDFGQLQDHYLSVVCQHQFLSQTTAFKEQGYPILCERFRILTENYFVSDSVCDLMLLGQVQNKSVIMIMYSSGTWKQLLEMKKEDFSDLHLSVSRRDLNVLGIQNNQERLLQCMIYQTNMCRDRETTLGSLTFPDVKISSVELDDTVIGTAYNSLHRCDFLSKGPEFTQYWTPLEDVTILRIQLVLCKKEVFMVEHVKKLDVKHVLNFYKLSSLNEDRKWKLLSFFVKEEFSTNWFAYFFPPSKIALRFMELTKSLYCNFEKKTFKWVRENNMITGAVSMDVFCWNVICLSNDGWVYYQDLREPQSNWKTIKKCPVQFTSYQQVVTGTVL